VVRGTEELTVMVGFGEERTGQVGSA
jgi:hypothetical protein